MNNKKRKNVTIKNIAEQLGVSFSTVSKALNNNPVIKMETRKRVHDKAAELGYFPNAIAKGLRSKSTNTVGIILNDIENPTRSYIVKKISVELAKHGFTALIYDSLYDIDIEKRNIISAMSRMLDGVVISPVSNQTENLSLLNNIFSQTVILSKQINSVPANYVHMDHKRGGYLSASTMLNNGHTQNIILAEPIAHPSSAQFIDGVRLAYKEYNLSFDEEMVIYTKPSIESGFNSICKLYNFEKKHFNIPFTGIIANYEIFAFGVYKAASKIGFKIPDDVSLIGYDDNPMSGLMNPPLSTIYMPIEEIASHCVNILVSKLINQDTTLKSISLQPHLVQRDSVKNIAS